jgi:hypothetical protein
MALESGQVALSRPAFNFRDTSSGIVEGVCKNWRVDAVEQLDLRIHRASELRGLDDCGQRGALLLLDRNENSADGRMIRGLRWTESAVTVRQGIVPQFGTRHDPDLCVAA